MNYYARKNYRASADDWIAMCIINNNNYTVTDTDDNPRDVYEWLYSIMIDEVDNIEAGR